MTLGNVKVIIENGSFTAEEAQHYIDKIKAKTKFTLKKISFNRTPAYLDIRYSFAEVPFERLRRLPLTSLPETKAANN